MAERKLKDFVLKSNTFGGFTFKGNYSMSSDDFVLMFDYYIKTGKNLLDDYSNMIYLGWDNSKNVDSIYYYDIDMINAYENSQSRLRHSGLFTYDWLAGCRDEINLLRKKYKNYIVKKENEKRIEACRHISKPSIRKKVFELYGKKCLCCGSKKNLTIDHVIPVDKSGDNDISNYQPLCKSCNSKKGTKIIDYR